MESFVPAFIFIYYILLKEEINSYIVATTIVKEIWFSPKKELWLFVMETYIYVYE